MIPPAPRVAPVPNPGKAATQVVAVVIGRNEGARLLRCLHSLEAEVARITYVDSGSTDGSAQAAAAKGVDVVPLDMSRPFTAARARNAGLERVGPTEYVQFVDADCEVQPGWIAEARCFLDANSEVAAVTGRLRERHPETSVYNRLCDREWDTPIGEANACGGIAMMRLAALTEVGGFDPSLIAGEEPELCVRLRAAGWTIWRLDAEMALHDAAMTRFGQFWKRARRGGHAFAEGAARHGGPPERHFVAETRRALLWGAALPAAILGATLALGTAGLLPALLYPVQVARVARRDGGTRAAWEYALFLMIGKFAEAQGAIEYHWRRKRGRPAAIMEYK